MPLAAEAVGQHAEKLLAEALAAETVEEEVEGVVGPQQEVEDGAD